MSRKVTVAAAQTAGVLSEDLTVGIGEACKMVDDAAGRGVEIISFCELFLTPFFPNCLEKNFEKWFINLSDERI